MFGKDSEVKEEWLDAMTGGENVLLTAMANHHRHTARLLLGIFGAALWCAGMLTEIARHMGAWKFFWE